MKAGDQVVLDSPYGVMELGDVYVRLTVKNGAKGEVVRGPDGGPGVRVQFNETADRLIVTVPIHWLARRSSSEGVGR